MAAPSTPENVERARRQIEDNLQRSSKQNANIEELRRLRLEQVILVAERMHRERLAEVMAELNSASGGLTATVEALAEDLIRSTHLNDVYSRAKEAIEQRRLQTYIQSVERQLGHATLLVRAGNGAINALSRTYYISARAIFLKECDPEEVDRLTGLEPV